MYYGKKSQLIPSYEMLYKRSPFYSKNSKKMFQGIISRDPVFPRRYKYSEEAIDLISRLLKKNPINRIGYEDEQEIFTHPWFDDINFEVLATKKVTIMTKIDACYDHSSY